MLKKFLFTIILLALAFVSISAQSTTQNSHTVMVLPFENISAKQEFNWVGESLADSLSDLLKVPGMNVITNQERKIIQQRLRVPLTILPSLATSLKLAREAKASVLIAGKYNIAPAQGDTAAVITITTKVISVNEGRFLSEEINGKRITRDITVSDALGNLQTMQGQIAYVALYQLLKTELSTSQNQLVDFANKVPARAFEAYIKGLLTPEGDFQTRENYFKNAMRIYSEDEKTKGNYYLDAALELGHLYMKQSKYDEAVKYFALISGPVYSCIEKIKNEDKDKATEEANKSVQNQARYSACYNDNQSEAVFYSGLSYWQQKNYEQAFSILSMLAKHLRLVKTSNVAGATAVQLLLNDKKNVTTYPNLLKEGLNFLKEAVESDSSDVTAHFNYGVALFLNNNLSEAAAQFKLVVISNQRDGEAYFLLAKILERQNDSTAANFDDLAKRFLTENNRYAKFETAWKSGKFDNINLRVEQPSRKEFIDVILIKKQSALPEKVTDEVEDLLVKARVFYKDGRDDEALEILKRISVSDPMKAEAYLLRGLIFFRHGNLDESAAQLKTATFWDNKLIDAYIALSKIYIQKVDCLQAKNYAASAAAIDAENEEVGGLQRMVDKCSTK